MRNFPCQSRRTCHDQEAPPKLHLWQGNLSSGIFKEAWPELQVSMVQGNAGLASCRRATRPGRSNPVRLQRDPLSREVEDRFGVISYFVEERVVKLQFNFPVLSFCRKYFPRLFPKTVETFPHDNSNMCPTTCL